MPRINPPEPVDVDESTPPSSVDALLNITRLTQIIKQHGVTGLIIVLLAYQIGWLAKAQSHMCGA